MGQVVELNQRDISSFYLFHSTRLVLCFVACVVSCCCGKAVRQVAAQCAEVGRGKGRWWSWVEAMPEWLRIDASNQTLDDSPASSLNLDELSLPLPNDSSAANSKRFESKGLFVLTLICACIFFALLIFTSIYVAGLWLSPDVCRLLLHRNLHCCSHHLKASGHHYLLHLTSNINTPYLLCWFWVNTHGMLLILFMLSYEYRCQYWCVWHRIDRCWLETSCNFGLCWCIWIQKLGELRLHCWFDS